MKTSSTAEQLLMRYPLISDQVTKPEVQIILEQLQTIHNQNVTGDVVEFGCFTGTTSLFIRRLLMQLDSERAFHVYDSFAGLPDKSSQDNSVAGEQFKAGELSASKTTFITNFKKAGLPLPIIHKGWFSDFTDADISDSIAFAFLDGDFYGSIKDSLQLVWPRLTNGAIVVIDDYQNEALPGAARATDEWLKTHPVTSLRVAQSLAIIRI